MALPAQNLDDRTFQDLVNEARSKIPQYCPEWTDHNLSDPGITLIELFAWMTELIIYRLNRVPDKNYVKFLDLIGVRLTPGNPARTQITFRLTAPTSETLTIPRGTEVATVRTETQNAIVFTTDEDLSISVPRLDHFLTTPDGTQFEDRIPLLEEMAASQARGPGQRKGGGNTLPIRQRKRGRVHDDQAREPPDVLHGPSHPDHPAPVVDHQADISQVQLLHQRAHVRDTRGQRVLVVVVIGLVGVATSHVIERHGPMTAHELLDEIPVEERPGRIAVKHEHGFTRALVDVVEPVSGDVDVVRGERVECAHQSTPNIMQLRPLPMPRRPTRCPGSMNPRS